jgi:hypothetical protein
MNRTLPTYIAGPMTGLPDFNHETFHLTEKLLKLAGFDLVKNPARIDGGSTFKSHAFYMSRAISLLLESRQVLFLKGWRQSKGARLEYEIGKTLGYPLYEVLEYNEPEMTVDLLTELNVADEAVRAVFGDRGADYGPPTRDFLCAANIISAYLSRRLGLEITLGPDDIPPIMMGIKLARLAHKGYHRDSVVDICGYALTWEMVDQDRNQTKDTHESS